MKFIAVVFVNIENVTVFNFLDKIFQTLKA